jgi:hypothetical protein
MSISALEPVQPDHDDMDIDPKDVDEFVLDQIGLSAKIVWACVQQIAL